MCRIAGIVDQHSATVVGDVLTMRDAMEKGGPDSYGLYQSSDKSTAFGHRRLSIIDLCATGNQPMLNEDETISLIFNGEIYNYNELKNILIQKGYSFKTNSDTEVILVAYQCWSTKCFSKFRGMFAIALLDKNNGKIILARDHAGIKPLYYFLDKDCLYFSSEIRAFKKLNPNWETNKSWKIYFLTYGYLPGNITTLKGVKPLEKGSCKEIDIQTLASKQFYFFEDHYTSEISNLEEAKELIEHTLQQAVQRHLIADAPIGLFLSGGIDSSLLTLLAKKYKENLHTLSIVFDDKKFSEKKYQDIIATSVGSEHLSFLLDKKIFLNALPDIFLAMDQPSSDGINSYFISKFAKEAGLKAVLSGLGADELFGGYASFQRTGYLKKMKHLPGVIFDGAALFSSDRYKKLSFLSNKNPVGEYLFNRGYFTTSETAKLLGIDVQEVSNRLNEIQTPDFLYNISEGNKVSYLESNLYMESQLLKDTDYMSMWHSIEVRVPFLDYDLIQAVQRIDSNIKFNKAQGKYLLIESFKDILPEEIWNRKKQGFVFPFQVWMKDNLDSFMEGHQHAELSKRFKAGRLSWSRYWTYMVSQKFDA